MATRKAVARKPARKPKAAGTLTVEESQQPRGVAVTEGFDFGDLLSKLQRVEAAAAGALDVLPAWCDFLRKTLDAHAPQPPTWQALDPLAAEDGRRWSEVILPLAELSLAGTRLPNGIPDSLELLLSDMPTAASEAHGAGRLAIASGSHLGRLAIEASLARRGRDQADNQLPDDRSRFDNLRERFCALREDLRYELQPRPDRLAGAVARLGESIEAARAGGIDLQAALWPDLPREPWWQGPAPRMPIATGSDLLGYLDWIEGEAALSFRRLDLLTGAAHNVYAWLRGNVSGGLPDCPDSIHSGNVDAVLYRLRGWLQATSHSTSKPATKAGKPKVATINSRMLDVLQKEPESMDWTSKRWASKLGCSKGGVCQQPTWKEIIMVTRHSRRADREIDARLVDASDARWRVKRPR